MSQTRPVSAASRVPLRARGGKCDEIRSRCYLERIVCFLLTRATHASHTHNYKSGEMGFRRGEKNTAALFIATLCFDPQVVIHFVPPPLPSLPDLPLCVAMFPLGLVNDTLSD